VAHHLEERLGDVVMAHHGSLSRRTRLEAAAPEGRRTGAGGGDGVAGVGHRYRHGGPGLPQIGSPRSIAVPFSVRRSGTGVLGPRAVIRHHARELVECTALLRAIRKGELDRLEVCDAALDILAQQIVASSAGDDWGEDDLFTLVRSTYPYRDLSRADFDAVVEMLSDGIATSRGRTGAYLHRDGEITAYAGAAVRAWPPSPPRR
jgi:ATP-dependent Lhr-like helicase